MIEDDPTSGKYERHQCSRDDFVSALERIADGCHLVLGSISVDG